MFLWSCTEKSSVRISATSQLPKHNKKDTIQVLREDSAGYAAAKVLVVSARDSLRGTANIDASGAGAEFTRLVCAHIFPNWYGTRWEFHGTTEVPRRDAIACGFFVTTVLRDAGMKLNRIRLACCASEDMIKALTSKSMISRLSNVNYNEFLRTVRGYGDGLFIVGLDCHTGFLLNQNDTTYFIHSCYIPPKMVIKERADTAIILRLSKYKVVGRVSQDNAFVKRWLAR